MGAALTLFVSVVEVCRRGCWCVLKLETEHLTNSSKYRALLWVPKLNTSAAKDARDTIQEQAKEEATWESLAAKAAQDSSTVPAQGAATISTVLALARLKARLAKAEETAPKISSKWASVRQALKGDTVD